MHFGFFLVQLINLLIVLGWIVLAPLALWQLRQRPLTEGVRVAWAILIVIVPVLGAVAFWLVNPGGQANG